MAKEIRITSVKPVPGAVGPGGDIVLKYEVETPDGPMHLHFTSTAASELKGLLDTSVKTMKLGGGFKPKP